MKSMVALKNKWNPLECLLPKKIIVKDKITWQSWGGIVEISASIQDLKDTAAPFVPFTYMACAEK
jgi:hypothetical protein